MSFEDVQIPDAMLEVMRTARSIVVMTGAGVSAESGIPTFRDALEGLWAKYDPEDLATPAAFRDDPARVTRWYDERRLRVTSCRPNPGHDALARLEAIVVERGSSFTLLTQNVDRLHQAAGSRHVVELHGSLLEWRCTKTGEQRTYLDPTPFESYPPPSEHGGLLRPGVVWFGESLPAEAVRAADAAVSACDVFMSIGTSSVVYPAAEYLYQARENSAWTIEVNLDPTPASHFVNWCIAGKSGEVLPVLVAAL